MGLNGTYIIEYVIVRNVFLKWFRTFNFASRCITMHVHWIGNTYFIFRRIDRPSMYIKLISISSLFNNIQFHPSTSNFHHRYSFPNVISARCNGHLVTIENERCRGENGALLKYPRERFNFKYFLCRVRLEVSAQVIQIFLQILFIFYVSLTALSVKLYWYYWSIEFFKDTRTNSRLNEIS